MRATTEGRLSYSKVRLIARVAAPETDAKYAKLALAGGVRYLTAVVRQHAEIMHVHNEAAEHRRYFQVTVDEDGMFTVRGRLSADEGAILLKALEAAKSASNADNCEAVTQVATAAIDRLATGDDVILHVDNDEHICAVEGHACARATADLPHLPEPEQPHGERNAGAGLEGDSRRGLCVSDVHARATSWFQ